MIKYLLFERLNNLTREDFLRFDAFLRSPYFHKGEKAVQFMDTIRDFHPDFNLPKTAQHKLKKLVPSQSAFDVLLSRLNDLLDEYELYESFREKGYLRKALKYELELEKMNNVKWYHTLQQTSPSPLKSSDDYYADFYREFSSIAVCENNWNTDKSLIMKHSQGAMNSLLYFFLSKYLMVYSNKITHTLNMSTVPDDTRETHIILSYVKDNLNKQPLPVQCVYYVIQLFSNISGSKRTFDHYFHQLKAQSFALKREEISYEIKYSLIQASSACIFKCYQAPEYFHNAFEMIDFLLLNDMYFDGLHEQLIQQRYILVVKVALGADQINWAKGFVGKYIHLVAKDAQQDIRNYAMGLISFQEHDYDKAVKLMVKINLNSAQFTSDYKMTLLKMYYELDQEAGFKYQFQTFLKFLKKDKSLNKTHKKNLMDSMELIRWFFKYKKNKKMEEFREKIKSKKLDYLVLNYRDKWFGEKYQELVKVTK